MICTKTAIYMLTAAGKVVGTSFYHRFLAVLGVAVSAYLLGSLCFAIIFTKIFIKKDIRKLGSGTAGAANVMRSAGFIPGFLTILFDFAKGFLAVYVGYALFVSVGYERYTGGCFAAIFALLGHFYPVFFKYRGGKGVVTMGGIVAILHWKLFLVVVTIYLLILLITKITSLAALVTFVILPFANLGFCIYEGSPYVVPTIMYICVSALVIYAHKENIRRLKNKTEPKLVIKKTDRKT